MKIINYVNTNGICELCGKFDELRPYGPNGERVCFECGMKDEAAAKRQFEKIFNGADVVVFSKLSEN